MSCLFYQKPERRMRAETVKESRKGRKKKQTLTDAVSFFIMVKYPKIKYQRVNEQKEIMG